MIGVELNPDAVHDAKMNARENKITNTRFYQGDAGEFMEKMAEEGERADVVFMDPPRTGSDKKFMSSVIKLAPSRIVYYFLWPGISGKGPGIFYRTRLYSQEDSAGRYV